MCEGVRMLSEDSAAGIATFEMGVGTLGKGALHKVQVPNFPTTTCSN